MAAAVWFIAAYLVGGIPFGYLLGRAKGVNLFREGSGNIGATNVGRILGRKFGILAFVFDFFKGVLPVAYFGDPAAVDVMGGLEPFRVGVAACAFLGHLFPIYLGFGGGKGVATGAGVVCVLVPGPAAVALLTWVAAFTAWRYVSLASILAVSALAVARCLSVKIPLAEGQIAVTGFILVGWLIVVLKHRSNIGRLIAGTESQLGDPVRAAFVSKLIHLFALGLWFGSAVFFNFVAALPIFDSFKEVVANAPSDRTAYVPIVPPGTSDEKKKELASALAGAAVGPLFPRYFTLAGICSWLVVVTSLGWRRVPGRINHRRISIAIATLGLISLSWPISQYVSELRTQRFDPDPALAEIAKKAFGSWHFVSLLLSAITTLLAGVLLAFAAALPNIGAAPSRKDTELPVSP